MTPFAILRDSFTERSRLDLYIYIIYFFKGPHSLDRVWFHVMVVAQPQTAQIRYSVDIEIPCFVRTMKLHAPASRGTRARARTWNTDWDAPRRANRRNDSDPSVEVRVFLRGRQANT